MLPRRVCGYIAGRRLVEALRTLQRYEPVSMTGQPPIVWDRAEGFQVCDAYGNHWLDWSSGVVAGLHLVHPGGKAPDGDPTVAAVEKAFQKGLLLVVPVGFGGATLKVTPPLTITSDAVHEGLAVLAEAIAEAMVPPRQT